MVRRAERVGRISGGTGSSKRGRYETAVLETGSVHDQGNRAHLLGSLQAALELVRVGSASGRGRAWSRCSTGF